VSAHTPAPWAPQFWPPATDDRSGVTHVYVVAASGDEVGCAYQMESAEATVANGLLMAAAPDLLAALKMICDSGVALADPIEAAMLAAIAKAEGRA
jgi:hypothetical protein